eukprot:CAMPEP_0204514834 /NCGR_PEP_ID=MMETSP0661-20131031/2292_1 /ASSEMBLY_ACC=CAM_ASM_000606 /TAXON_ID=109239 /ORGANISM="Alexandrium margalefi, Strain AMGDE01CS-322" /LENGTH=367 /DNA_ID=CAMNT_0051520113 /DNA_START=75 /DNA_END=1178 /DNA_ORIENTATION=-
MEDSHITISDLGGEHGGVSIFGVFDGHGGREVAHFVREHLPDEVRRQLRRIRDADGSVPATHAFGEALTQGFHTMDNMVRSREYERELLSLKQGPAKASQSAGSGSSSSGSSEGGEEESDTPKPRVVSVLQSSIQSDLAQARDRGSLSKEEATQVMMKMALLRRLENQGPAENPDAGAADNVGCTAVCILMSKTEVVCANAGDSRAVLCRNGQAVELSHDHKPNDAGERRRIEAAGGRVEEIPVGTRVHHRVNGNLNLSRSIGDLEYKKKPELGHEKQMICSTPDIIDMPLTKDDEFIVLACDGVWDVKSNQEVCDFVGPRLKKGQDIPRIVEELLDDCIAVDPRETHGLGGDNMTCVVVQLRHDDA